MQLREDAKMIQQKGRPIPIHLQQSVKNEREKSTKQGHIKTQITSTKTVLEVLLSLRKERQVDKNCTGFTET